MQTQLMGNGTGHKRGTEQMLNVWVDGGRREGIQLLFPKFTAEDSLTCWLSADIKTESDLYYWKLL